MKNLTKALWAAELLTVLLIASRVADYNMAYITLFILIFGIWKLPGLEALKFYIYSIPIFVVLPPSALSEAMSVWRFALLFFILKVFLEKFAIVETLKKRELVFADKKNEIMERFGDAAAEAKTSNYHGVLYAAAAFGLVGALSLFFAADLGAGIKELIFLGSISLLFGIVFFVSKSKDDVLEVLRAVFVSGVGILAVGYGQFGLTFVMTLHDFWGMWDNYIINALYGEQTMVLLSYSNTWFSYYDMEGEIPPTLRMFSVMPDSHSFAFLMIIFIPLAIYYSFAAKDKSKMRRYAEIMASMLLAIYFSGTRGAWVGWLGAFAAAFYLYFHKKIPRWGRIMDEDDYLRNKQIYKKVLASILLFVVVVPVAAVILNVNQDVQLINEGRMLSSGRKNALIQRTWSISDFEETSNKGRMEIWSDSVKSFMKHPITGIGIGNFPLALSEKTETSKMGASAHNIYLEVLVEMGLIGLGVFLWLLYRIAEKLFRLSLKLREDKFRLLACSVLVAFAWISVYGLFDVVFFNDKVLMFFVLILAALYKLEDLEEKEVVEAS
jgi:hypothetical protein